MNREDYLLILKENLINLEENKKDEILQYYSDYFEEINNDKQIVEILGKPEDLAKKILEKEENLIIDSPANNTEIDDKSSEDKDNSQVQKYNKSIYFEFKKSQIRNIEFNFGAANVVLVTGKKVSVEARGLESEQLLCKVTSDRSLLVKNLNKFSRLNFFNHNRSSNIIPRILITLPKSTMIENLSIIIGAGRFEGKNIELSCQKCLLEVGAAMLKFDSLQAKNAKIACGMGKIDVKGSLNKKIDVDCGMGFVNLDLIGDSENFSYDAKVGLGLFKINEKKFDGVNKIFPEKLLENHFSVNCGMGNVSIKISK